MSHHRIVTEEAEPQIPDGTLILTCIPFSDGKITVACIKEGDSMRSLTETEAALITTLWDCYFDTVAEGKEEPNEN